MKKFFLPIFAVLLVLGSILPLAAYRVTRAVLSGAEPASFCCIFACSICAAAKCRAFCGCRDLSGGGSGHRTRCWSFPVRNTFWVLSPPRCR